MEGIYNSIGNQKSYNFLSFYSKHIRLASDKISSYAPIS